MPNVSSIYTQIDQVKLAHCSDKRLIIMNRDAITQAKTNRCSSLCSSCVDSSLSRISEYAYWREEQEDAATHEARNYHITHDS